MATKSTPYCDICGKPMWAEGYVITFELGYSKGRWGRRNDLAAFRGDHCCSECFKRYEDAAKTFTNTVLKKVQS